jgi:cation-transporting ATPase E
LAAPAAELAHVAIDLDSGLSAAEVADRVARHLTNDTGRHTSRSIADIVRANVFTPFNLLLGVLLVAILITGQLRDSLFGIVLVTNTAIGIIQEWRAKQALDRLAVLSAPRARVRRDGEQIEIDIDDIVQDDLVVLTVGDQVPIDGLVIRSNGLEVDESLLTGEADSLYKEPVSEVMSGSVVVAGDGLVRATRVGREAYAVRLAEEAGEFALVDSELRNGINRIVTVVGWAMIPTAILLLISQWHSSDGWRDAVAGVVSGLVGMVPEGLVLLTSVAFALGVLRLARRHALVQELAAVETLARVDVLCADKTGTITSGEITFHDLVLIDPADDEICRQVLGSLSAADAHANPTLLALADMGTSTYTATEAIPFSSARKWSAATLEGAGTWVLGAPEILLRANDGADLLGDRVDHHARAGHRVLLLARLDQLPADGQLVDVRPVALAVLEDVVRPDAAETLRWFRDQEVTVKVISGDNPVTVAAIARRAGLDDVEGIDAHTLTDDEAIADAIQRHTVFGRVTPQQKRAMVRALQQQGRTVAMTGDGVNDVLALKDADMGIAMGNGSDASRAIAQLVLLDSSFASLPRVVAEGRRVINNVERIARLFITKTTYSLLLAVAVGVARVPFPFLPRHLTLIGGITIGIPGFFLALEPNDRLVHGGFVRRVLRFAVPSGTLAAVATFVMYMLARQAGYLSSDQRRTVATLVLVTVGLWVLARLMRPLSAWRAVLLFAMVGALVLVLVVPYGRHFFALDLPPAWITLSAVGVGCGTGWLAWIVDATWVARGDRDGALYRVAMGGRAR